MHLLEEATHDIIGFRCMRPKEGESIKMHVRTEVHVEELVGFAVDWLNDRRKPIAPEDRMYTIVKGPPSVFCNGFLSKSSYA